jgi:hypothetical protein
MMKKPHGLNDNILYHTHRNTTTGWVFSALCYAANLSRKVYDVAKGHDGEWKGTLRGASRPSISAPTKAEALERTVEIAKRFNSLVAIGSTANIACKMLATIKEGSDTGLWRSASPQVAGKGE